MGEYYVHIRILSNLAAALLDASSLLLSFSFLLSKLSLMLKMSLKAKQNIYVCVARQVVEGRQAGSWQ